ncbi:hypothetical protein HJC23_000481 [Cyclotella cryptica]|uniref:Uncharacterized protein n=1 Tax=Cyclotella cryptica TaxID=29204 RepID=A0ABD3QAP2_9STRA
MTLSSDVLSSHPNIIASYKDGSDVASLHSSSTFPQQFLQRDEPQFPIDSPSFDDYSFAPPILRTTSFQTDDDGEVFYTPVAEDVTAVYLTKWEPLSLPVTAASKKVDFPTAEPASRSLQASPSSPSAASWESRNRLRLNLPFKLKGFRNVKNGKRHSFFTRKSKKCPRLDTSESVISVYLSGGSIQMESPLSELTHESQEACSHSCNSVAETEKFSNLTSRLVEEGDANGSADDIQLNPILCITKHYELKPGDAPRDIDTCEEVELVYNDRINGVVDSNEGCDLYFAGGSLHTIRGACVELSVLAKATPPFCRTNDRTGKTSSTVAAPANTLNATASVSSASGSTCSMSTSSHSSVSTSGILKPPKRAVTGYDPFGVHTDFTTGMPKRHVHFFENIEDIETAHDRDSLLLSQASDSSDDSTLSLEYAFRYLGCASSFSGASHGDCDEDA